jgi:hypothetical protein
MMASATGLGPENECAGEGLSSERIYIRTMISGVQLRKKILAVSLKGLGAKAN